MKCINAEDIGRPLVWTPLEFKASELPDDPLNNDEEKLKAFFDKSREDSGWVTAPGVSCGNASEFRFLSDDELRNLSTVPKGPEEGK